MAVFWFGWAKKLKNVFTKKEADTYYLQKNSNQLQDVRGFVDFYGNIAVKNNGYVDNRIKTRTETQTINVNSTYIINPTAGYQVVSVMVGRKRTSDNYYFFEYPTTLNKQVFLDNTSFKVYNQGNVSGFNNEFKIVILEMKV